MSESLVVNAEPDTGYRFSWGLVLAGGVVAAAVTFFLLTLGAGVGLLLVHPETGESGHGFLTGGAIYFFAVQAFGFAVGGHVTGRLLGPLPESHLQEEIRAALHGLVVWAVTVLVSAGLVAIAGAATAKLYGASQTAAQAQLPSARLVDKLFRPGPDTTVANPGAANPAAVPPSDGSDSAAPSQPLPAPVVPTSAQMVDATHARAEADRILDAEIADGGKLETDDRNRLIQLTMQQAGVSSSEARLRVSAAETLLSDRLRHTTEVARKSASYVSLWIAFSLLFGALVAMIAAVTARLEDDRESLWTPFALHRGWRR